jgi:hypothetical protein
VIDRIGEVGDVRDVGEAGEARRDEKTGGAKKASREGSAPTAVRLLAVVGFLFGAQLALVGSFGHSLTMLVGNVVPEPTGDRR